MRGASGGSSAGSRMFFNLRSVGGMWVKNVAKLVPGKAVEAGVVAVQLGTEQGSAAHSCTLPNGEGVRDLLLEDEVLINDRVSNSKDIHEQRFPSPSNQRGLWAIEWEAA
jgi:hypothetical protein